MSPVRFGEHDRLVHERGYHVVRFTTHDHPVPEFQAVDFMNRHANLIDVIAVTSRDKACFLFFKSRIPEE